MDNLLRRARTLKYLNYIFLGSLIVSACAFVMILVTTILSCYGVLYQNPGAVSIVVIDYIIGITKVLLFLAMAVTFICAYKINKGCKTAFYIALAGAVIQLAVLIIRCCVSTKYIMPALTIIANGLMVFGIYFLVNSIFEGKAKKHPTMFLLKTGLIIEFISAVFVAVATIAKFEEGINLALIYTGYALDIVAYVLIYVAFYKYRKAAKQITQDGAELIKERIEGAN